MLPPFAVTLPGDVGRHHFAGPNRAIVAAVSSLAPTRHPRLATPAPSPLTVTAAASSPDSSRSAVVDVAVEGLESVAIHRRHRQARNGHRLARPCIPTVVAVRLGILPRILAPDGIIA